MPAKGPALYRLLDKRERGCEREAVTVKGVRCEWGWGRPTRPEVREGLES